MWLGSSFCLTFRVSEARLKKREVSNEMDKNKNKITRAQTTLNVVCVHEVIDRCRAGALGSRRWYW